jgi:hypothetical protein
MRKDKAIGYTYSLIDPRDKSVFYIGKGKGARIDAHEKEAIKGVCSNKCNKIREILDSFGVSGDSIIKSIIEVYLNVFIPNCFNKFDRTKENINKLNEAFNKYEVHIP